LGQGEHVEEILGYLANNDFSIDGAAENFLKFLEKLGIDLGKLGIDAE
jgi:hypothetical protein